MTVVAAKTTFVKDVTQTKTASIVAGRVLHCSLHYVREELTKSLPWCHNKIKAYLAYIQPFIRLVRTCKSDGPEEVELETEPQYHVLCLASRAHQGNGACYFVLLLEGNVTGGTSDPVNGWWMVGRGLIR